MKLKSIYSFFAKYHLTILSITIFSLVAFLLILLTANANPTATIDNSKTSDVVVSQAVSYTEIPSSSIIKEDFVPQLEKTTKTNLYYDCGGDYKIAPVDITIYDYSEPVSYSSIYSNENHFSAQVFRKMADYINNDEVIRQGYESMNNVISTQSIDSVQLTKIIDSYGLSCTGGRSLPIIQYFPLEISSNKKSMVVLSYGSNQSVISSNWVPVFIDIILVADGNYTLYSTMVDYNELVVENKLNECEELTEYGYPYIKIFPTSQANQCVLDKYNKYKDDQKINKIIDKLLKLFEIL